MNWRSMWSGGLMMAVCLAVVAVRPAWHVQLLALFVLGFAFYMLHGCIQVHVTELAPQARGSAAALHSAFFFLGQAIGPIYYGIGFAQIGVGPSLGVGAAALATTGIVCAVNLARPRKMTMPQR